MIDVLNPDGGGGRGFNCVVLCIGQGIHTHNDYTFGLLDGLQRVVLYTYFRTGVCV